MTDSNAEMAQAEGIFKNVARINCNFDRSECFLSGPNMESPEGFEGETVGVDLTHFDIALAIESIEGQFEIERGSDIGIDFEVPRSCQVLNFGNRVTLKCG